MRSLSEKRLADLLPISEIRRDLKIKDDENRLKLYKYYIPLIVDAVSDSIKVDRNRLSELFIEIAEKHVKKEIIPTAISSKDNGETNVRKKQMMSAREKNSKTENKNTMVKEEDVLPLYLIYYFDYLQTVLLLPFS